MFPLTLQALTTDPARTLASLMDSLAESGRVARLPGGTWALLDPVTGRYTAQGCNGAGARNLINTGLLQVLDGDRLLGPGRSRGAVELQVGEAMALPGLVDRLPQIGTITRLPAVRFNRTRTRLESARAGLDAVTRTLYVSGGLDTLETPDPAYPHLRTIFSGLQFADPVYHANLIGVVLAAFARTAVMEFPLVLLDANGKSTGKTKTVVALGILLCGEDPEPVAYTGCETEMEKQLGKFTQTPGPNFIFIDNVRPKRNQPGQIRNQVLSAMATAKNVCVRGVYRDSLPIFDPIVFFTMNGARVERDLGDKIVRVSLYKPKGAPAHREIDPNPIDYARVNRGALLAEIFHLLEHLELPPVHGTRFHTRFYDFERIAIAGAKVLGLEASFDPNVVHNADALVHELYYLLVDEFEGRATFGGLVEKIMSSTRLVELREVLQAQNRTDRGLVLYLQEFVETALLAQRYKIENRVFTFRVEHDTISNQKQLRIVPEAGENDMKQ